MKKETAQSFARDIVNLAPEDFHGTVAIPTAAEIRFGISTVNWVVVVMLDGEVDDVLVAERYAVEFLEDWKATIGDIDDDVPAPSDREHFGTE